MTEKLKKGYYMSSNNKIVKVLPTNGHIAEHILLEMYHLDSGKHSNISFVHENTLESYRKLTIEEFNDFNLKRSKIEEKSKTAEVS